jgi:Ulp1 protease family, C-terminal catalytic domain
MHPSVGPYHFPGDPRFGVSLSVEQDDVRALRENQMLSTRLLDFVIQRGAPRPSQSPSAISASRVKPKGNDRMYVGSLGANTFIKQANALFGVQTKQSTKKIDGIKAKMKSYSDDTISNGSKLAIPLIFSKHFFVVVLECWGRTVGFYNSIHCYDSNMTCTRLTRKTMALHSELAIFLQDFHQFVLNFVVCDGVLESVRLESAILPPKDVMYYPCPSQQNGIDCGLFAVAVILHLIDGIVVEKNTFDQSSITNLRKELAHHLSGVATLNKYQMPAIIVRKWFPQLQLLTTDHESVVPNDEVNKGNINGEVAKIVKKRKRKGDKAPGTHQTLEGDKKEQRTKNDSDVAMLVETVATRTGPNPTTPTRNVTPHTEDVTKECSTSVFQTIINMLTPTSAWNKKTSSKLVGNTIKNVVGGDEDDKSPGSPVSTLSGNTIKNVVGCCEKAQLDEDDKSPGNPVSTLSDDIFVEDSVWGSLLKELNIQSFASLDDVTPVINDYQKRSGNHLAVCNSERDRFRLYRCVEHLNCTFRVHIGRRRLDGRYVIKKQSVMRHTKVHRPSKDKNGRKWKERRAGRVEEIIAEASNMTSGSPSTRDVMTMASLKGEDFPYHAVYRAIHQKSCKPNPPPVKLKKRQEAGSPKVKKRQEAGSPKVRCLQCNAYGHNRRACNWCVECSKSTFARCEMCRRRVCCDCCKEKRDLINSWWCQDCFNTISLSEQQRIRSRGGRYDDEE